MKALILSCNTGGGHNAAGHAMKEAYERAGHRCDVVDTIALTNQKMSDFVSDAYLNMVNRVPEAFGMAYNLWGNMSSEKRKSPLYYMRKLDSKNILRLVERERYDVIIATHIIAAESLTVLKKDEFLLTTPCIYINTDYTCVPFEEDVNCDRIIIPHKDLTEEFLDHGLAPEKLLPLGIPVRKVFSEGLSREEARKELGMPEDASVVLMMGGSMGFGNLTKYTAALKKAFDHPFLLYIICGNNEEMKEALSRRYGDDPEVRLVGYTSRVADYMAACDVLLSKPGGLSSTEAIVSGTPLVHTPPIPGCETANAEFFNDHGISYAAGGPEEAAEKAKLLCDSTEARDLMKKAQRENSNGSCADDIVMLSERLFRLMRGE